jgi:hypothetical protein
MLMKVLLKTNPMKQTYSLLVLFVACATVGCGSSKVVVDEDAIQAQIAKVEAEERAHNAKVPLTTHSEQPKINPESEPGAEGSN